LIQHTYIEFLGLELADPLTFISDLLMTLVAFYCGHKIFYAHNNKYAKFVGMFFFFMGASSLIGGTGHLLDLYFGKTAHLIAWTVQGLSIIFIELASIRLLSRKYRHLLRTLVYAFFGVFISRLFDVQHFDIVKVNASVGLIGFAVLIHLVAYFQYKKAVFLRIPLAISLFLIPAAIHGLGFQLNAWINHNVISHLALLPCYYMLYYGCDLVAAELTKSKTLQILQ